MKIEHTCDVAGRSPCDPCVQLEAALWDAINQYAISVGGDPSSHIYGNVPRMQAVVDVGVVIGELCAAARARTHDGGLPVNPDCTGTVGRDFVPCGEAGYYCSDRCWTIGRLVATRALVVDYERQLGVNASGAGWLLLSATDLPQGSDALGRVIYCIDNGAVFLEFDQAYCQEILSWLAQRTEEVTRLGRQRSHPVLVVLPLDFDLDRSTRDQIIQAGGMPIHAPANYNLQLSRDVRLSLLREYLQQLRTASTSDGFRRVSSDLPDQIQE